MATVAAVLLVFAVIAAVVLKATGAAADALARTRYRFWRLRHPKQAWNDDRERVRRRYRIGVGQ
jgi:hypothetical protein